MIVVFHPREVGGFELLPVLLDDIFCKDGKFLQVSDSLDLVWLQFQGYKEVAIVCHIFVAESDHVPQLLLLLFFQLFIRLPLIFNESLIVRIKRRTPNIMR